MKNLLSVILALVMLMPFSALTQLSVLADTVSTGEQQNPFYAGREIETGSLEEYTVSASATRIYGGETYYSDGKQLYTMLSDALQKRRSEVTLYYLSPSRIITTIGLVDLGDHLFDGACDDALSTNSVDGDYVRWSMSSWNAKLYQTNYNDYYYYKIILNYSYYDTADEENAVKEAVKSFINSLDTYSMSDYEIIKRVHDYICSKTTYNYNASSNIYLYSYSYSAYGALIKGSAVCQGYSLAFYRICKELGFNCRIITSTYYYDGYETGHAWNLVCINDRYYYVDCTWDDELIDTGKSERGYDFFLVDYDGITASDKSTEHLPDEQYYDGEYYNTKYRNKIDSESYDSTNEKLLSNCVITPIARRFTYTGGEICPPIKVTTLSGKLLSTNEVGAWYWSNVNLGTATVCAYGKGEYSNSYSSRYFTITPAKMGNMWFKSGSRGDTYLTVEWNAMGGGISGYYIEEYKDNEWKWVKTAGANETSAKLTSLKPARAHYFRIRAYKSTDEGN
ncbi:MAG: fibronectin type III domain-containing protein [Eubacterium sp.]|nr:fibronectin type III domain-containing protein [Eubacterium sp.]